MNRKKLVIKNIIFKWIGIVVITILQFISRRIFINFFTDDLLGLSSLLQSVISMLSLMELGVGTAIVYTLYEPLSRADNEKIAAIMNLYKKIYSIIGLAVLVIGFALTPFLPIIIKTELSLDTVRIAYVILLIDTVCSYFMAYRRNIFIADQKEFICTNVDTIVSVLASLTQIIVTIITGDYYLFLIGKVIWIIGGNVFIYYYSDNKYSYLNTRNKNYLLTDEYISEFKKNVKSLFITNLATYMVFSTDNILISSYVSVGAVFIYSNYSLIISTVNKIFHNIFNSAQASIGNYNVTNDITKSYGLFNNLFFINYLVTCFTSVSLITILNTFIEFWLGDAYVWPIYIVAVLVINNYLRYINQTVSVFRNAIGLYSPYKFYKYWGFCEGIVNIVVSLFLIYVCKGEEILAVFLGTTISTLLIFTFSGSHALFKYYFGIGYLKEYIIKFSIYSTLTLLYSIICVLIVTQVSHANIIIRLCIAVMLSAIVPNILNILIFRKTDSYRYILNFIKFRNKGIE